MKIFISLILLALIATTPANADPVISPLSTRTLKEAGDNWQTTPVGLMLIERLAEDGEYYMVAYNSQFTPCSSIVDSYEAPDYFTIHQVVDGAPDICYLVFPEAIGYIGPEGVLVPLLEITVTDKMKGN